MIAPMVRPLGLQSAESVHHLMSRGIEERRICAHAVRRSSGARLREVAAAPDYRSQSAVTVVCLTPNTP